MSVKAVMKGLIKKYIWGFFIKRYSKKDRQGLINKNFTIICPNCTGGWIYRMVESRYDSPTLNLWIDRDEFLKMCSDLKYYMEAELHFYHKDDYDCPCAYLGEGERAITIAFIHYDTEKIAREKWEERKKRIHWDNLYIMTTDDEGIAPEDYYSSFDHINCKRKIVFTSQPHPEIPDAFQLKTMRPYSTAKYMQLRRNMLTGLRGWEYEFDYVAWLNGDETFRRNKRLPWMFLFRRIENVLKRQARQRISKRSAPRCR